MTTHVTCTRWDRQACARALFSTPARHTPSSSRARKLHRSRIADEWVGLHTEGERERHTPAQTQSRGRASQWSDHVLIGSERVCIYSRKRTHAIPERFFLPLAVSRVRWLSRRKPPAAAAVRYCPNLFLAVTVILPRLSGLLGYLLRNAPLLLEMLCRRRRPVLFGFFSLYTISRYSFSFLPSFDSYFRWKNIY